MKLSIIIPAYNEEEVIEKALFTLKENLEIKEPYEILVINDGSTDRTKEILENLSKKIKNLRIISHKKNKGLGGAIKTGIQNAKGEIIIELDADMTHPLDVIPEMIKKINQGYDMCIASRYLPGGGMKNVPIWRILLSKAANKVFSIIYCTKITDLTSGYRAYRSLFMKEIKLSQNDFSIQLEISVIMTKNKAKITETPLVLTNRSIGVSKFNFIRAMPKYIPVIIKLFFIRWID